MEQVDFIGQRFKALRQWLDVSHRAIGRLVQAKGVVAHESLWATWETRLNMISAEEKVRSVLQAVAEDLEGKDQAQMMFAFLKGERELPKKKAVWKTGKKPALLRGRKPGAQGEPKVAMPEHIQTEGKAIHRLATEIAVDAAMTGEKLPEKVGKLIQTILAGSARHALGLCVSLALAGTAYANDVKPVVATEKQTSGILSLVRAKRRNGSNAEDYDEGSEDDPASYQFAEAVNVDFPTDAEIFFEALGVPTHKAGRVRDLARAARTGTGILR